MPLKRKAIAYERGQELWFFLPESERTAVRILNELRSQGFVLSKATVSRWATEWRKGTPEGLDLLVPISASTCGPPDISDVPEWAKKALPPHVWAVAKGAGLDRVESAVGVLADELAAAAPRLVETLVNGDERPLQIATGAITAIAAIMEKTVRARLLASVAHRLSAQRGR